MQSTQFAVLLAQAVQQLQAPALITLLKPVLEKTHTGPVSKVEEFRRLLLAARSGLDALGGDQAVQPFIVGLHLRDILADDAIAHMLARYTTGSPATRIRQDSIFLALYYRLTAMLDLTRLTSGKLLEERLSGVPAEQRLDIVVIDYGEDRVPLARFAVVVSTLTSLYGRVGQALALDASEPRIVLLDSGSELKISIQGVAEVIHEIRTAIADAFRGIRYWKLNRQDRAAESFEIKLRMLDGLQARVRSGAITQAEADQFQHLISRDIAKMLGAGAMPVQAAPNGSNDHNELLTAVRDAKLLTSFTSREGSA